MVSDFYPDHQIITNITNEQNATVTTLSNHGYIVGQIIRIVVPIDFGMTQINGLTGTIISIPALNQISVDINSSSFDQFSIPVVITNVPQTIPVGETARDPWSNSLGDATRDLSVN